MKCNDREVALLSKGPNDKEGSLNYSRANSNNIYALSAKERFFILKGNLLFYFRISDAGTPELKEPVGILVLENCKVQVESRKPNLFAFSIVYNQDTERRHILSCRTESKVDEWIKSLEAAPYEYWRMRLLKLQKQISLHTGKDPLIMVPRNEGSRRTLQWSPVATTKFQSGFESHITNTRDDLLLFDYGDEYINTTHAGVNKVGNTKQSEDSDDWEIFDSYKANKPTSDSYDFLTKQGLIFSDGCSKLHENTNLNMQADYFSVDNMKLRPAPSPPIRQKSIKAIRTHKIELSSSMYRASSANSLNTSSIPTPPMRKKSPKNLLRDTKKNAMFYDTDEDSDNNITINPIYQSTSEITQEFDDMTINKNDNNDFNLIEF